MLHFITVVALLGLANADPIKKCKGEYDMEGKTFAMESGKTWKEYDKDSDVERECTCQEYRDLLHFDCGDADYCSMPSKTCLWQGCPTEAGGIEPWYLDYFPYNVHKEGSWIITYPQRCYCECVKPSDAVFYTYAADSYEKPYVWDCDCDKVNYYDFEEEEGGDNNEIEDRRRK